MKRIIILTTSLLLFLGCVTTESDKKHNNSYEPEKLTANMDAPVLIYVNGLDVGVSALTSNNPFGEYILRSSNGENFSIVGFNSITISDAFDVNDNVVSFVKATYTLKSEHYYLLNDNIEYGEANFENLLDMLTEEHFDIEFEGDEKAPDKNSFVKVRNAYVYNFVIKDSEGKTDKLQLFVETFRTVDEL